MRAMIQIAKTTFIEALRSRVFLNVLIFGTGMVLLSIIVGSFSLGAERKIVLDIGFASIIIFGTFLAVFIGAAGFAREVSKKTVYAIIARKVSRWQFVVGKYLGLLLVIAVNMGLMVICIGITLIVIDAQMPANFFWVIWLSFLELSLIGAIATAFATYSGVTLSVIFSIAIFISGSLAPDLLSLVKKTESAVLINVVKGIYYLLPDLSVFSIRIQVANELPVENSYLMHASIYGFAYTAIIVMLACLVFSKKELV